MLKKRIAVHLRFPDGLLQKIEEYQKKEMIPTRTGAIYERIRKGLRMSNLKDSDTMFEK